MALQNALLEYLENSFIKVFEVSSDKFQTSVIRMPFIADFQKIKIFPKKTQYFQDEASKGNKILYAQKLFYLPFHHNISSQLKVF